MKKNLKHMLTGLGLMVVGLLGATSAHAQGTPSVGDLMRYLGSTPANDMSIILWSEIFGKAFVESPFTAMASGGNLLGSLFIVFNTAVFVAGMVWLGYGLGAGIIGTAQEGQALGQRINSAWYPIRVVTGTAGMVPILGGFTLSQGMLMWIATLGIGIANTIFNAAIDNAGMGLFRTGGVTKIASAADSKALATAMLRANICLTENVQHEAELAEQTPIPPGDAVKKSVATVDTSVTYTFGSPNQKMLCGQVAVKRGSVRTESSALGFRNNAVNYEAIARAAMTGHAAALTALDSRSMEVATEWMNYRKGDGSGSSAEFNLSGKLDELARNYRNSLNGAVQAAISGSDVSAISQAAKANMREYGWFGMGAWFSTFAEVNAAIADATGSISISATAPRSGYLFSGAREAMSALDKKLEDETSASGSDVVSGSDSEVAGVIRDACKAGSFSNAFFDNTMGTATGNCSLGQNIVGAVIQGATAGSGGGEGGFRLINPIIGIKNVGDYMLTITSSVFFGSTAMDVASKMGAGKVVGTITDIAGGITKKAEGVSSGISEKASSLISTIGMLFFAAGAFMSLYIPMIPFVIWIGGLVAYAASFIEGFVAMPLHSMSHLDTDGEGMGQRTGHGYLFFLNTFARPALMVLSFIISSGIVIALGTFVTLLYMPAMANVQGNSVTGLISIFGLIVIYGVIMSIIINNSFDLIQVIPDQVIGFVGSGSVSTKLGQDTEGKINHLFMAAARLGPQVKGQKPPSKPRAGQDRNL